MIKRYIDSTREIERKETADRIKNMKDRRTARETDRRTERKGQKDRQIGGT